MQAFSLQAARRRLAQMAPKTGLGRFTLYLLVVDVFIYLLNRVVAKGRGSLDAWIVLLTAALVVLSLLLGFRWFRRRFMWRLRNRLIVTYIFIGVIPLVLVLAMALIAGYLFAGQFATFLATSDLQSELRTLHASNSAVATELATVVRLRGAVSSKALLSSKEFRTNEQMSSAEVLAWHRGERTVLHSPRAHLPIAELPAWLKGSFRAIVRDQGGLYLRAVDIIPVEDGSLAVLSSLPVDKALLERMAVPIGEVTIYPSSSIITSTNTKGTTISVDPGREKEEAAAQRRMSISGGAVPPQVRPLDREITFFAPLPVVDWATGERSLVALRASTRPSLLYGRLFQTMVEFGSAIWTLLIALAIVFAIIELVALIVGVGLTRTMTRSVAELYRATQHVNRGDLKHRITITAQDQLAALESSFNSMSESLEKLIAEQKEKQRLENELAIAQEVQAQLFPKGISELATLEVHGFCRPARTVSGDYYDFLGYGPERLGLAVGDISGKGISAALLMATIHSAVRAYEFGRLPAVPAGLVGSGAGGNGPGTMLETRGDGEFSPAQVLALLNRQLYRSTPAEKYATLFLGVYDGHTRQFTYSNAGHLPPVVLGSDGSLRRLDTPGLVVGLFDDQSYEEREMELRPGDIFVAFSDGVTEPENEYGEFGEDRLIEIVRDHRLLPLVRISEMVLAAVGDWIGSQEQPDDVTLVLARAR